MNQEFEILQANMKILRILSDCSQEETAEKLHISRSTYASYEAGFRTPDLVILQKLSRLYDVSLSDLVYLPLDDLLYSQLPLPRIGSWKKSMPSEKAKSS